MTGAPDDGLSADHSIARMYAPPALRPIYEALFRFDRALSFTTRTTQPMLGQIRRAWWREALLGSEKARDPLLKELRDLSNRADVRSDLMTMVNGWETLSQPGALDDEALGDYARDRGGGLFAAAATLADSERSKARDAGAGWALIDFAFRCSDRATAARALAQGRSLLDTSKRWPAKLRPLAILRRYARRDAARGLDQGSATRTPSRLYDALAVLAKGE